MSWPGQAYATTIGRLRVAAGVTAVGVAAGRVLLWLAGERSLAWLAWTLITARALIPLAAGVVGQVALGRAAWVSGGANPAVR